MTKKKAPEKPGAFAEKHVFSARQLARAEEFNP
jgi:hypothetical protein